MSDEKCDNCGKDGNCEEQESWVEGGEPDIMRALVAERGCALFQPRKKEIYEERDGMHRHGVPGKCGTTLWHAIFRKHRLPKCGRK